jgi:valyl-tRNA synthetase
VRQTFTENQDVIQKLARVSNIEFSDTELRGPDVIRLLNNYAVQIIFQVPERTIDIPAERERLTKDIAKYEKGLAAAERQLGNDGFLAKAPANVVEGLKKQQAETKLLLYKAQVALNELPKS